MSGSRTDTGAPGAQTPRAPFRLRDALVLLVPLGVAHSVWLLSQGHPVPFWVPWMPFVFIHGLIPALDAIVGDDRSSPRQGAPHALSRWVLWACLPVWLAVLLAGAHRAADLDGLTLLGLMVSCGAAGGIVAINVAHELIHRTSKFDRAIGGGLLATVAYGAFKVEHVRGHHLRVATPDDTATAQRGEGLWRFMLRSMFGTYQHALAIDAARKHPETLAWTALTVALWMAVGLGWGATAFAFMVAVALLSIVELEVVNYIEHYGLQRARLADGRYEPVMAHHSWNANTTVVNAFLLNLQRHSDHHAHAGKPFTALQTEPSAPQLPAGYGAMVLLAWVPPLWRAVMDPRLDRYLHGSVRNTVA